MTTTLTEFTYDEGVENGYDFSSDAIETIAYNRKDKALYVEFVSGGEYVYNGVEESTYNLFVTSDSKGRFWRKHIEGEFGGGVRGDYLLSKREDEDTFDGSFDGQKWPGGVHPTTGEADDADTVPVSRFSVKWTNGTLVMEPEFYAASEAAALVGFNTAIEQARSVMPNTFDSVRIVSVTHHFE